MNSIFPKKKPINGILTATDKNSNESISQDRVVVANFFGRLHTFEIFSQKRKLDQAKYNMLFKTGVALTNASTLFDALRANDRRLFVAVHNRMFTIGENISDKKANSQAAYRDKRQKILPGSNVEKNSKLQNTGPQV